MKHTDRTPGYMYILWLQIHQSMPSFAGALKYRRSGEISGLPRGASQGLTSSLTTDCRYGLLAIRPWTHAITKPRPRRIKGQWEQAEPDLQRVLLGEVSINMALFKFMPILTCLVRRPRLDLPKQSKHRPRDAILQLSRRRAKMKGDRNKM